MPRLPDHPPSRPAIVLMCIVLGFACGREDPASELTGPVTVTVTPAAAMTQAVVVDEPGDVGPFTSLVSSSSVPREIYCPTAAVPFAALRAGSSASPFAAAQGRLYPPYRLPGYSGTTNTWFLVPLTRMPDEVKETGLPFT